MSKLSACLSVGILALAACGDDGGNTARDAAIDQQTIDAKVWMDAPPPTFDFSCETNKTPPTTTAANVTLSGTVQGVTISGVTPSFGPVEGASLTACVAGAANCTGGNKDGTTATSSATGTWTIGPFPTGGAPQDDFVEMTKTGWRTVYTYPDSPFVGDQANIPMLTFDAAAEGALSGFLNCNTSQAIVGLALVDCAGMPITDSGNVMLSVKQSGAVVAGTTTLDAGTLNAAAAGSFLVCGVPAAAATEVSATYLGHTFVAHSMKTVAGDTSATLLVPGY
jgi:hypothetical protein